VAEIEIEQRSAAEVSWVDGPDAEGVLRNVRMTPEGSPVANYGFDVTPSRLVTGLITERGVFPAEEAALVAGHGQKSEK
jgi:methylthioribose-1-phosphate isomerase